MKLMQLNLWLGRLTPQILELIDKEQPDFITSQEVYRGGETVRFPDNMFTIFEQIAEKYPYHSFSAVHATKVAHSVAEMGNAIFSKYPIVESNEFFTHGTYNDDLTKESHQENSRTLQTAIIDVDGKPLTILNHHGHWDRNPMGTDVSIEKMQSIADYIRTLDQDTPIIFAGDLNVVPASPAMRPLDGLMIDLVDTYNITSTISAVRDLGDIPCDHILVNDAVSVKELYTLEKIVSDHKPVVLEFEL